jgi:formate hydrogenlyase subunit 6/NADH:ubiquinone oxidoreductase subunit I
MLKRILNHILNTNEIRKIDTEFYPDPVSSRSKDDFPARSRGLIVNKIDQCTGCGDCVSVCPTSCITVEAESIPQSKKNWVSVFDVDFSNCLFCGKCVEVCDPQSLTQTKQIQPAVQNLSELRKSFGKGSRR